METYIGGNMKIQPVGSLRDLQIAQIKFPEESADAIRDIASTNRWSTNRTNWELWDELDMNFTHIIFRKNGLLNTPNKYIIECVFVAIEIAVNGKDFADCVSQAWIQWKRQQRAE